MLSSYFEDLNLTNFIFISFELYCAFSVMNLLEWMELFYFLWTSKKYEFSTFDTIPGDGGIF